MFASYDVHTNAFNALKKRYAAPRSDYKLFEEYVLMNDCIQTSETMLSHCCWSYGWLWIFVLALWLTPETNCHGLSFFCSCNVLASLVPRWLCFLT
jgi:hypothetical protein